MSLTMIMWCCHVLQRDACGETSINCSDVPPCDGTTVVGWYSRPPYIVLVCGSTPAAAAAQQLAAVSAMARAGFAGPATGALHFYRRQQTAVHDIEAAQAIVAREAAAAGLVFKSNVARPLAALAGVATPYTTAYFEPVESGNSRSRGVLNGGRQAQAYEILCSFFPHFFPEEKSFSTFVMSRMVPSTCTPIIACLERFDDITGMGTVLSACVVFVYANVAVIPFFGTTSGEQGQGWGKKLVVAVKAEYITINGGVRRIVKVDVAKAKEGFWAKCGMQRTALSSAMAKQIVGASASGKHTKQIFSSV